MGGTPKALIEFAGSTLLERAVAVLAPQVGDLAVNLPPDLDVPRLTLPIVRDEAPSFEGPLAGVLAGFDTRRSCRPRRPIC